MKAPSYVFHNEIAHIFVYTQPTVRDMNGTRPALLDWFVSSLIVAGAMASIAFGAQRIYWIPPKTRDSISGLVLFVPGLMFFFPVFIRNVHDFWEGYLWLAAGVNWLLYTSLLQFLKERWRARRTRREI